MVGMCHVIMSYLAQGCHGSNVVPGLQELAGDNRANEELVCPEATAGLWSTITFSWVSDLMKKGYKCVPLWYTGLKHLVVKSVDHARICLSY